MIIDKYKDKISDMDLKQLLECRIYAKKMVKKKYRDFKYDGRKFWNWENSHQQYAECVEYIWKPSVDNLKKILGQ